MNYPLFINFKKIAIAPQFKVTDANGDMVCYVRQKLFKLKEDIKVYKERERQNLLYSIRADRIIDFSAKYTFYDSHDVPFGAIKRKGMKSLWRAQYLIDGENNQVLELKEESVLIRFLDRYVGWLCGSFFFHPVYNITRADGTPLMRVKKMPSLFEAKFKIELLTPMSEIEEMRILLGSMMMLLLERYKG